MQRWVSKQHQALFRSWAKKHEVQINSHPTIIYFPTENVDPEYALLALSSSTPHSSPQKIDSR